MANSPLALVFPALGHRSVIGVFDGGDIISDAGLLLVSAGRSTKGVLGLLRRAVRLVRARFPHVQIVVRGDCGFGYGEWMNWCDKQGVDYTLGFQATKPLLEQTNGVQIRAALWHRLKGDGCREYGEGEYQGQTWTRARRIILKAEVKGDRVDARFVVSRDAQSIPEEVYADYTARGDREKRIKEMKLGRQSGRTSCHRFLANQFRLLLHAAACVLSGLLQEVLAGTRFAKAQVSTLRLRLLKVGARVVATCRRICFHLPSAFPEKDIWQYLHQKLVLTPT